MARGKIRAFAPSSLMCNLGERILRGQKRQVNEYNERCPSLTPAAWLSKIGGFAGQNPSRRWRVPDDIEPGRTGSRFRAIITDLHFWIPLFVFLGGLILLDKLR